MEKRWGLFPAAAGLVLAATLFFVGPGNAARPASPSASPSGASSRSGNRIVTVLALAEAGIGKNESWKIDMTRTLMHVGQIIEETAGVKLRIKAYGLWDPTPSALDKKTGGCLAPGALPGPLTSVLAALRTHLDRDGRGSCDIAIAFAPEDPEEPRKGIADYLSGIVLLQYFEERSRIPYVLLHELCHIFGAVDLEEEHSVMSRRNPSFGIDAFTTAIMNVNRERCFRLGECPLARDRLLRAITLYEERRSRGLGENELDICLRTLRSWAGIAESDRPYSVERTLNQAGGRLARASVPKAGCSR